MPFHVSKVDLAKDWDELFAAEWAACMHSPQAIWELMFPVLGNGPSAQAEAIKRVPPYNFNPVKATPTINGKSRTRTPARSSPGRCGSSTIQTRIARRWVSSTRRGSRKGNRGIYATRCIRS